MNGQLGTVPESKDGLLALIVIGATAVSSTFAMGEPYRIYRPAGLEELGVTEENNGRLVELVSQFYTEAQEGTPVYVVGYGSDETMTALCSKDTGKLKGLMQSLKGELRGLVLASSGGSDAEVTEGIDSDVLSALPKAQELAEHAALQMYAPVFIALEGKSYSGKASELKNLSELSCNRCCIVLGDTKPGSGNAAMGIFAGRIASVPVHRNIGRTADGTLSPVLMYIGDRTVDASGDDIMTIYDKGYVTPRAYVGRTGYFFTDDRTACDPTDDYAHLTSLRTIDKAARIAYDTLLDFMLSEIEINEDGTMQEPVIKSWQAEVENAINSQMTAKGELSSINGSGCRCFIDPKQNVLQTSTVIMTIKVQPYGYARTINVDLGFLVTSSN